MTIENMTGTYHVEGHDIPKRNVSRSVTLHEGLVDDFGTTTRRKTKNKRLILCGLKGFDATWEVKSERTQACQLRQRHTDDIIGDVF